MSDAPAFIGTAGWGIAGRHAHLFPAPGTHLERYARRLGAAEINSSFYRPHRRETYARWAGSVPAGFRFSVKLPKAITHERRLAGSEALLDVFLASVDGLGGRLGVLLVQLPPSLRFDPARFEAFFEALPHDTGHARALAARHDARMKGRASLAAQPGLPLCHAIEIRHDSFLDPAFTDMLRHYGIALVVADTAGKWPYREDVTADFVYIRLHGDQELYVSGYTDAALDDWAGRIAAWARGGEPRDARRIDGKARRRAAGRHVFCYFDNDAKVEAPRNAKTLMGKLGLPMQAS